jgi:hypothetical protein
MNDQSQQPAQSRSIAQRIEERIDQNRVGQVALSDRTGGLAFANLAEVMETAKLMSIAGAAVPMHLRNKPGECLAICIQAFEWRMSPFAVANKSYVVNDRLSFESQLIHAVIEQRAPLKGRLRHEFSGEGDSLTCKVWGTAIGEDEPLVFVSSPIAKITPKNSPLWKTKPALQLYYNASRDWCRMYFPDVVLGVYSRDEIEDHIGPERARDVTPPRVARDHCRQAGCDCREGGPGYRRDHHPRNSAIRPRTRRRAPPPTPGPHPWPTGRRGGLLTRSIGRWRTARRSGASSGWRGSRARRRCLAACARRPSRRRPVRCSPGGMLPMLSRRRLRREDHYREHDQNRSAAVWAIVPVPTRKWPAGRDRMIRLIPARSGFVTRLAPEDCGVATGLTSDRLTVEFLRDRSCSVHGAGCPRIQALWSRSLQQFFI